MGSGNPLRPEDQGRKADWRFFREGWDDQKIPRIFFPGAASALPSPTALLTHIGFIASLISPRVAAMMAAAAEPENYKDENSQRNMRWVSSTL